MPTASDGHPPDLALACGQTEDGGVTRRTPRARQTAMCTINMAEPFHQLHPAPELANPPKPRPSRPSVRIWSLIDISFLSSTAQFVVIASGIMAFFIMYGYLQEKVTGMFKQDKVHLGWFMTSIQFAVSTSFTFVQTSLTAQGNRHTTSLDGPRPRPPLRSYALIGTLSVMSTGLSNTSCEYLSYPTQVMFKCSKLIPVMIVGVVMLKKTYRYLDYMASAMISIGLIMLSLADHELSANFDIRGIIPISLSLCAGAFIGNFEEKLYRQYCPTEGEMIFYTKGCGFVGLALIIIVTGQLRLGVSYTIAHPAILSNTILLALAGVLGEYFIMLMTRLFGALATVTTTSCRKALTLYLSFVFFPKPYSHKYVFSCALIFLGIFLNVYSKNQTRRNCHDDPGPSSLESA